MPLDQFIIPLITFGFWLGSYAILRRYLGNSFWDARFNTGNLLKVLIGWTLLGFVSTFENTTSWGCILLDEPIFSSSNILLSSVSLALLIVAFYAPKRRTVRLVACLEIGYWLFKFLFYKAGYAVGFGGSPDPIVMLFDITSIYWRFALLATLFPSVDRYFRLWWIIALFLILLKSLLLPLGTLSI